MNYHRPALRKPAYDVRASFRQDGLIRRTAELTACWRLEPTYLGRGMSRMKERASCLPF
jgi:hypothetical protein